MTKPRSHLRLLLLILFGLLSAIAAHNLLCEQELTLSRGPWFRYELRGTKDFSIIVLPDTQNYVKEKRNEHILLKQISWIIQNKNRLNIKFVIQVGDIVSTWNSDRQWQAADRAFSRLEKHQIPYSLAVGNHEHEKSDTRGATTGFDQYFSADRFTAQPWWGGHYNRNTNSYQLLSINDENYIFLSLDWCPSADEIQWAKDVLLNQYPKRKAILTTHGYLDDKTANRSGINGCDPTEYIFNDLIRQVPNLQIVLSGHEHDQDGTATRVDLNLAGKPVYQIMTDYQSEPNGGNGWLRILRFVPEEQKIYLKTYSPHLNSSKDH